MGMGGGRARGPALSLRRRLRSGLLQHHRSGPRLQRRGGRPSPRRFLLGRRGPGRQRRRMDRQRLRPLPGRHGGGRRSAAAAGSPLRRAAGRLVRPGRRSGAQPPPSRPPPGRPVPHHRFSPGHRQGPLMIQHLAPISGIDAAPGHVATAGYDNQLILWDRHGRALAGARHGRLLVSASSDYTARVWALPGLASVAVLGGHRDDVEMAVFSPDESRVATASRDCLVRIFDAASGTLQACLEGHQADVISVEWAAGGQELVSSGDDGTIRRFSAGTGALLATTDLDGVEADTVVCGPAGVRFVGTDRGEIVTLREDGRHATVAHASGIKRRVYQAASATLLSASYDRQVKLWRVAADGALALRQAFTAPPAVWLRCAAFADPASILFGTFGSSFARYRCDSGQWCLDGVTDTPGINAVRPFGGAVCTVGDAGVVRRGGQVVQRLGSLCNFLLEYDGRLLTGGHLGQLFDAVSGALLYQHHSPLNCGAAFLRDGSPHVVIGSYTGECIVLRHDGAGALRTVAVLRPHDNAVKGIAASAREIFTVCATGAAAFIPISSLAGTRVLQGAHERISNGAALLPDGGFASISRDRKLRLWRDGAAGVTRVITTPHFHSIKCVAVCPRSGLIATGSYNGMVAVYDEAAARWVRIVRPTQAGISSLAAAREAGSFLASAYDGKVHLVETLAQAQPA